MGLRFRVLIGFLWLPRPLCTPAFSAEGDSLQQGLDAWRRLRAARGPVRRRGSVLQVLSPEEIKGRWQRLRSTYLEVLQKQKRKGMEANGSALGIELLISSHLFSSLPVAFNIF